MRPGTVDVALTEPELRALHRSADLVLAVLHQQCPADHRSALADARLVLAVAAEREGVDVGELVVPL